MVWVVNPHLTGLWQIWAPFYEQGLTLIPARISNYTHYNVRDGITPGELLIHS